MCSTLPWRQRGKFKEGCSCVRCVNGNDQKTKKGQIGLTVNCVQCHAEKSSELKALKVRWHRSSWQMLPVQRWSAQSILWISGWSLRPKGKKEITDQAQVVKLLVKLVEINYEIEKSRRAADVGVSAFVACSGVLFCRLKTHKEPSVETVAVVLQLRPTSQTLSRVQLHSVFFKSLSVCQVLSASVSTLSHLCSLNLLRVFSIFSVFRSFYTTPEVFTKGTWHALTSLIFPHRFAPKELAAKRPNARCTMSGHMKPSGFRMLTVASKCATECHREMPWIQTPGSPGHLEEDPEECWWSWKSSLNLKSPSPSARQKTENSKLPLLLSRAGVSFQIAMTNKVDRVCLCIGFWDRWTGSACAGFSLVNVTIPIADESQEVQDGLSPKCTSGHLGAMARPAFYGSKRLDKKWIEMNRKRKKKDKKR